MSNLVAVLSVLRLEFEHIRGLARLAAILDMCRFALTPARDCRLIELRTRITCSGALAVVHLGLPLDPILLSLPTVLLQLENPLLGGRQHRLRFLIVSQITVLGLRRAQTIRLVLLIKIVVVSSTRRI